MNKTELLEARTALINIRYIYESVVEEGYGGEVYAKEALESNVAILKAIDISLKLVSKELELKVKRKEI